MSSTAHAQQLRAYGGVLQVEGSHERASVWALDYAEPVAGPLELGVSYLNQGHLADHHRDGVAMQAWLRSATFGPKLTLAAGIGPYYYFDTVRLPGSYENQHGWGVLYSALLDWQLHERWSLVLRANHAHTHGSFTNDAIVAGVGYRWGKTLVEEETPEGLAAFPTNSVTTMLGRTIVNSFESERAVAGAVEYRRVLRRWAEWTVTFLDEGDARLVQRNGIASQLWLTRRAHDDRVALSLGVGPYLALDRGHAEARGPLLAGLVSLSASYAFTPRWQFRTSWNRVLADYHRDTDVFLAGIGYGF